MNVLWSVVQLLCSCVEIEQARRQDLAAGGSTFFKYCIGCMQQPGCQTWNGEHI